jgi:uncharacterized membrane protein
VILEFCAPKFTGVGVLFVEIFDFRGLYVLNFHAVGVLFVEFWVFFTSKFQKLNFLYF